MCTGPWFPSCTTLDAETVRATPWWEFMARGERDGSASPESELLRTIVDDIDAMLAYWDASLRCRFANRAYERWLGVSHEELIGRHMSELLGPLYELDLSYIQGALRGEPQELEREIPDPRGGPARASLTQYMPDVVDGVVGGFSVLVTDVSALKRAEVALRESEERFRLTLDEAPIGMALVAPDGRFLRVNCALCDILGYTSSELTGLTFQAITHPEDLDADLALAGQLARGEISRYKLAKRYIRKDGTIVDVMLSGSALRGPDGVPIHFIAQIEDVTEEKRIETEQRFLAEIGPLFAASLDHEQTLTTIAELAVRDLADLCIVDVVEGHDEVRRLKVASRDPSKAWLCELMTRIPLDRRRPHLLGGVLTTKEPTLLQRPSAKTLESLAQSDEHLQSLRAAEIRSMVAVPLVAHGKLLGAIALISSSDSRSYGAADVRLAEELAHRAALSIENAQLYDTARRATQARDDLLGIVAHDLRNPLNNVHLHAALLRRNASLSPPCRQSAEGIERAVSRMNRLIQDLLDVTRMDAGQLAVEPARTSARQLVTAVVESQRPLARASSIELVLELSPRLPDVWGDRDRLLQVFENLMGNAIKFTSAGGRIVIGAAPKNGDVLFSVTDTGCGMTEESVSHAFDRFWQATKRERRGAGLGLPIVKGVIEAHRGRIWIESVPQKGTSVFFTIPIADHAEARRGASATQATSSTRRVE